MAWRTPAKKQRPPKKEGTLSKFIRVLKESISDTNGNVLGQPKDEKVKPTRAMVLGAVEQNYGIYQIPSFRDQVTTMWDDPILKEALTMFGEQVVATGAFITYNPEYTVKLPVGKDKEMMSAWEVIKQWYDRNDVDGKLLEIAIELKGFGNSFWRLDSEYGFVKIPVEAVWHAVRIDAKIPLQVKYHIQLVPIYGGEVINWKEFIHFRIGATGYHAPFGQGVIYSLLAKPMDSAGNVSPSLYDIRLGMRSSLHEGFRKFSFGNELWVFEGMPNDVFQAALDDGKTIAQHIAEMDSTGNRIATNTKGEIKLAVPERTQSYDEFIKQMRDEFFMSLADPSLKLGLEQGFTKATSVTASEVYKYKIATMRKCMKEQFEEVFVQVLDNLGFNGKEAGILMNFGPEETAVYDIADIFAASDKGIVLKNEARKLLSRYHKWDISGDIKGGDVPVVGKGMPGMAGGPMSGQPTRTPQETLLKRQEAMGCIPKRGVQVFSYKEMLERAMEKESIMIDSSTLTEANMGIFTPQIVVTPLDCIARYSGDANKVYIDPLVPEWAYELLRLREMFEYQLEFKLGFSFEDAEKIADKYERTTALSLGIGYPKFKETMDMVLKEIQARKEKVSLPPDVVIHNNGSV